MLLGCSMRELFKRISTLFFVFACSLIGLGAMEGDDPCDREQHTKYARLSIYRSLERGEITCAIVTNYHDLSHSSKLLLLRFEYENTTFRELENYLEDRYEKIDQVSFEQFVERDTFINVKSDTFIKVAKGTVLEVNSDTLLRRLQGERLCIKYDFFEVAAREDFMHSLVPGVVIDDEGSGQRVAEQQSGLTPCTTVSEEGFQHADDLSGLV